MLRKGFTIGIVLMFLVSIVPFINGASDVRREKDSFTDVQNKDYPQYRNDWSVHLTNQISNDISIKQFYNNKKSNNDVNIKSSPIIGPMNSSWPMQSHDMYHTGRSLFSTSNNSGAEIWRVRGDDYGEIYSSAVVDQEGIIYFGTIGGDSSLYALYPNGTRKWKYHANGLIWSTPAIADDGTIYLPSWGSHLFALYPNGTVKWNFGAQDPIASSVTIAEDGTIYIGTMAGNLFAINSNGTEQWHLYLGGNLISSPAIGHNNTIYIGTTSNYFFAVNPNGTLKWRFGAGQFKGNPSIASDDTIYAPCFNGYLYAFYPNGTVKWQVSTGGSIAGAGVAVAEDETIYIGTELLRAYYPNGTLKWTTDVKGGIYGTVPAVSSDGTIYVSAGGSIVAVNPNGTERWRKQLTIAQIHSSPCIGPDNCMYVGSVEYWVDLSHLHAFGLGQPKNITIEEPRPGHWYLFSKDMGLTKSGNLAIIGGVKIKVNASIEQEIDHVDFYVAHFREVEPQYIFQYSDSNPPFEWNMNEKYGNDIFPKLPFDKLSIRVIGWYKGGCSWTDELTNFWYCHLLNN